MHVRTIWVPDSSFRKFDRKVSRLVQLVTKQFLIGFENFKILKFHPQGQIELGVLQCQPEQDLRIIPMIRHTMRKPAVASNMQTD